MTQEKPSFVIRNKIWIEDAEGNVVFGLGRYRMLDAVKRTGSLQAAAAEMKMSYKPYGFGSGPRKSAWASPW